MANRAALDLALELANSKLSEVQLEIQAKADAQRVDQLKATQAVELEKLDAQTRSLVAKAAAVSPDFIAALQAFGDKAMIEKVSAAMGPLAILGGNSVVNVAKQLLEGTPLAKHLESVNNVVNGNGTSGVTSKSRNANA